MTAITLTLTGRPRSTKNSRQIIRDRRTGRVRSVMSDSAEAWMTAAIIELRRQWKGRPSATRWNLTITLHYANYANLPDLDNAASAILDALKHVVVVDDSPKYIGTLTITQHVTRGTHEHVTLTLTPQEAE